MNRVLVAGIAGFAMLVSAGFTTQDCYAARKCGGNSGGLFSGARGGDCCGKASRQRSGGLLAKLRAGRNDCGTTVAVCCPAPVVCCPAPAPVCCPAPVVCCPAPAPVCCPAPSCGSCGHHGSSGCNSCGSCGHHHVSSGCSSCGVSSASYSTGVSNCPSCSQTLDAGVIMESTAPASAPPAPAPTPDPAADAPSA